MFSNAVPEPESDDDEAEVTRRHYDAPLKSQVDVPVVSAPTWSSDSKSSGDANDDDTDDGTGW